MEIANAAPSVWSLELSSQHGYKLFLEIVFARFFEVPRDAVNLDHVSIWRRLRESRATHFETNAISMPSLKMDKHSRFETVRDRLKCLSL